MMAMMGPPVGAGAIHPPHEQFHHLNYCVHSNPSWGKGMSRGTLTCFLLVYVLD
jgi:nucleobase transporter 1/2